MTADKPTDAPVVYQLPITGLRNGKRGTVVGHSLIPDDVFTRAEVIGLHWSLNTAGYASRTLLGPRSARRGRVLLHRIVFEHYHGVVPAGLQIDHIDRDRLNNLPENLRAVSQSINQANANRQRNNRSGFQGVSWNKRDRKWLAQIQVQCRKTHLGRFDDPAEAARAVNAAYRRHFPEIMIPNPHAVDAS